MSQIRNWFIIGLLALAGSVHAEDGSSGCGLGWKVAPQSSLISSTTRTIINNFTFSTVGMTLGTSGCTKHSIVQKEQEQQYFVESNFHSLMVEMAKGSGKYINSFALVMGCQGQDIANFGKMSQKHYEELFPQAGTNPSSLLMQVKASMNSDKTCSSVQI